jgi:hypothetical protein
VYEVDMLHRAEQGAIRKLQLRILSLRPYLQCFLILMYIIPFISTIYFLSASSSQHTVLSTQLHTTNTQLSTFKSQSPKLLTSTMGLIKTAIMTGGGIYAVDKLAKSVPLPFPFAYPLIPTY